MIVHVDKFGCSIDTEHDTEYSFSTQFANVMYITHRAVNGVEGLYQYRWNARAKQKHPEDFIKIALLDAADDPSQLPQDQYFVVLDGVGVKFCPRHAPPDYYLETDSTRYDEKGDTP